MREVCVWIPKLRAHEALISEALPHRRDVQQREVRVSSQRYESRVSMSKREAHEVHISQMSPDKCDNQQCEVLISSQQRGETRVSKAKPESQVCSIERELRVSEPCVTEACKVNILSPMARVRI